MCYGGRDIGGPQYFSKVFHIAEHMMDTILCRNVETGVHGQLPQMVSSQISK
jgi:hypothetical protein